MNLTRVLSLCLSLFCFDSVMQPSAPTDPIIVSSSVPKATARATNTRSSSKPKATEPPRSEPSGNDERMALFFLRCDEFYYAYLDFYHPPPPPPPPPPTTTTALLFVLPVRISVPQLGVFGPIHKTAITAKNCSGWWTASTARRYLRYRWWKAHWHSTYGVVCAVATTCRLGCSPGHQPESW